MVCMPIAPTGLYRGVHLRDFVLANQMSYRGGAAHDFVRRHATAGFFLSKVARSLLVVTRIALNEPVFFSRRKHINHTVDRLCR